MPNWRIEIDNEMTRAKNAQREDNAGRVRTSARRIAGIALQELQRQHPRQFFGDDYIRSLRTVARSNFLPKDVVDAAHRLQEKLSENFTSPSIDPIGDAMIIVNFVESELKNLP